MLGSCCDQIPPIDAAFLLRHFACVDIHDQLAPSDNFLLAVDFVVVLPCQGPTGAALIVATVILFVLDSAIV